MAEYRVLMYLVEFPRGATPGDDAQGGGRGKITKIKGEARHLETGAICTVYSFTCKKPYDKRAAV